MISSYHFGHKVFWISGEWVYADTRMPIKNEDDRRCPKCNQPRTEDGHDPCIKNLPGVMFACCGHGVERGYLFFENGAIIRMQIESIECHAE